MFNRNILPLWKDVLPVGYNASEYECRRWESNPHSRREHDFESCASACSATSAIGVSFPMRPKVYHSQYQGQDKITWGGMISRLDEAGCPFRTLRKQPAPQPRRV